MENMSLVTFAALCFGGFLLVIIFVCVTIMRRKDQITARYSVRGAEVKKIIKKAIQSKIPFTFTLYGKGSETFDFSCSCIKIEDESMTLLFDENNDPLLNDLVGRMAEISFSVFFDYMNHYRFQTTVMRTRLSGRKHVVDIVRPSGLVIGQRRQFVRYRPTENALKDMELWHALPSKDQTEPEWQQCDTTGIQINDVSASGMSLLWKNPTQTLQRDDHVVLRLSLMQDYGQPPTPLLVSGLILRISKPAEENAPTFVGIKFRRWSRYHHDTETYEWRGVHNELGVPPLCDWVVEQYRKTAPATE